MGGKRLPVNRMVMIVLGGLGILAGAHLAGAGEDVEAKEGVDAKAAFARLKTLAGTWKTEIKGPHAAAKAKEHKDGHAEPVTVNFKVTGAGSAVVETQFPGTGHEMTSVYHLDGDDLRMTHYCAMGNQPHVKLDRARSRPDHLIFVFDGGTNLDPKKDMHIHGLTMTFQKDGQVISDWEGYMGGKSGGITSFIMTKE
ncbi:MAG: hypothetical protein ACLQGP_21145 [Isosphaeraceae bacterium]